MSIILSNVILFFLLKLPEIDIDAFIMERILNSSINHIKQIVYRSFNNDNEYFNKNDLSTIKNTNLSLERLWHYSCYLTRDRNISCLCWNPQNHVR
jgi:hypothetical protein